MKPKKGSLYQWWFYYVTSTRPGLVYQALRSLFTGPLCGLGSKESCKFYLYLFAGVNSTNVYKNTSMNLHKNIFMSVYRIDPRGWFHQRFSLAFFVRTSFFLVTFWIKRTKNAHKKHWWNRRPVSLSRCQVYQYL